MAKTASKYRTILVGLGFMGSKWAETLRESEAYEPVAYVDLLAERRKSLKEKLGLEQFPGFASLTEALKQVEADVVVVATPAFAHYDICLEVIEEGLPSIVEKPIETDWGKAKAIVSEAEKRGVPLVIDQNFRYTSPMRTLKRVIQSGELGTAGFATVIHHRNRPGTGTYQKNMPNPMLVDMSSHQLDLLRFIFAREVVSVLAHSWNPLWSDYTHDANVDAIIELEDNLWVTYSGSNVSRGITIHPFGNWRIECAKGGVYLQSTGFDLELSRVPLGSPPKYKETIDFDPMPMQNQAYVLQYFKECLEQKKEPETKGSDNLKSLAIVMAIIASAERGETVYLKEFLED